MRHLVKGKKLGRSAPHRKATLRSLAIALIEEHRIKTTVAKAKALRPYVEPLITLGKDDTRNNRRKAFYKLNNKKAVSLLFDEVGEKAKDRPGGYTRIIKIGKRLGDGAETALMELVDYNDIKPERRSSKSGTRRSGS
jgi:large subunit ribosomal protein L17